MTQDAITAQKRLKEIQGTRQIWYCGAWTGFGFHEDGLKSGLEIAQDILKLLHPDGETSELQAAQ